MNQATYETTPTETPAPGATRVLIVDDEACISDLLFEMLSMLGYAPTKCLSPHTALELLERNEYDVILSDFRMPQMNGDVFFRRATTKNPALRTRFVFLTGDTLSDDTHGFLIEQGSRHLCKPFDFAAVEQVISEVVAQAGLAATS